MRLGYFVMLCCFCWTEAAFTQTDDVAQDYLSATFHAGRRDALRRLMPENSVTMVLAYPERTFSNDVDYEYHPNPDLYYFTGYKEPHALLLIFKEPQTAADGSTYKELFFIQKRNAAAEQWTGKRLGVEGVKEKLNIPAVYNGEAFKGFPLDLSTFNKVLFDQFPDEISAGGGDPASLPHLVQQFRQKAGIGDSINNARFSTSLSRSLTAQLREIKMEEEMVLLRKAVEISCNGQAEVMKAIRPDMSEREIQGLHEYVHKKYGAEHWGYPAIVGAGNNGCVLHYIENDNLHVANRMVLMDVGAEYHGYTADVTRTIPANGKFTADQKVIYELVYEAQEAAFRICKEGASWSELDKVSRAVITEGLLKLGIITKKEDARKYYPHGLGHHIGLDVHDRSEYGNLKKGMVITIEPGIYIPENSPCDKKWWGIAVRIEDDVLIREKDYELLSSNAPRKTAEIEKLIAEKSILDNFTLPPLKSGKKGF